MDELEQLKGELTKSKSVNELEEEARKVEQAIATLKVEGAEGILSKEAYGELIFELQRRLSHVNHKIKELKGDDK